MQLYPIKTKLIKPGDNLIQIILGEIKKQNIHLKDGDILALASKVVATANNRLVSLKSITASEKARKIAKNFDLTPEFTQLILRESDKIYGGVKKAILTQKNGFLNVNAGIDNKNAPVGQVVLPLKEPTQEAEKIRREIERQTGKKIGVIIVDSGVHPLRMGTRGFAIAVSGFKPVKDYRGNKDLFRKPIMITRHAVADDLASAAHFLMGEADEHISAVLIKNAQLTFTEENLSEDMEIPLKDCVFAQAFQLKET
jgi:coenzyme F420-0:L-glutamate ligase